MELMALSVLGIFILLIQTLMIWICYEIFSIRKHNKKILNNFIQTHKKKEEG